MSLGIGVLISGSGSNLQAIIDRIEQGVLQAEIKVVISDVNGAYGLERSRKHGLPTKVVRAKDYASRQEHDAALVKQMRFYAVDVVVLAGYMRLISQEFIRAFPQRILNIHPSLLPAFKGLNAQNKAWDYGVRISGATVHFVDAQLDHGPIIIQAALPLFSGEDADSLRERILRLEHRIYPQALQWMANKDLIIEQGKVIKKTTNIKKADINNIQPCLIAPPLEEGF